MREPEVFVDEAQELKAFGNERARDLARRLWTDARVIAQHTGISFAEAFRRLSGIFANPRLAQAYDEAFIPGAVVTDVRDGGNDNIEIVIIPYVEGIEKVPHAWRPRVFDLARERMKQAVGVFECLQAFKHPSHTSMPLLVATGAVAA